MKTLIISYSLPRLDKYLEIVLHRPPLSAHIWNKLRSFVERKNLSIGIREGGHKLGYAGEEGSDESRDFLGLWDLCWWFTAQIIRIDR